jgi:feruloyl esterase
MLTVLVEWVERGKPPSGLQLALQEAKPPFAVTATRPLCAWPQWPRYKGGDVAQASSFECAQ